MDKDSRKKRIGVFSREGAKGRTWYIRYSFGGHRIREKVGQEKHGITESMAREALKSRIGNKRKV